MLETESPTGLLSWFASHWPDVVLALAVGILMIVLEVFRRRLNILEKTELDRPPDHVPAESLITGRRARFRRLASRRLRKASGRDVVAAINRGALDLVRHTRVANGSAIAASPLETAWSHTAFGDYAKIAASFLPPACSIAAHGAKRRSASDDALAVLNDWLRHAPPLHAEIRGATGVGKTMLMHALFVDLVASNAKTVPMLASADNINQNSDELVELKRGDNAVSAFVSVWLRNRRVAARTEADEAAMVRAIRTALEEGDIVLLLDGADEVRAKGASDFVDGLLRDVKRWIVTRRYEDNAGSTAPGPVLTVDGAWSKPRILEYAERRLRNRPEALARVASVLGHVIPDDDVSDHWLSHPSNLAMYVDEVAPLDGLLTEAEMYRLADTTAGLMEHLVNRDMRGLIGAAPDEVRAALSVIAMCKPGDPRARIDGDVGRKVAGLKTLLRTDGDFLVFRHAAESEYFLTRRIARELFDGPAAWERHEALHATLDQLWGASRVSLVDEALRDSGPPGAVRSAIARWLASPSPIAAVPASACAKHGKRNLLEVWKRAQSDGSRDGVGVAIRGMDLSGMDGQALDLSGWRVESSSFARADLRGAELSHAQFIDCEFDGADLRSASAIGAELDRCSFGDGDTLADVDGMQIEGIHTIPPQLESMLAARGARRRRSRYDGRWGEQFFKVQRAFLGRAVDHLEQNSYVPRICRAIEHAAESRADGPIYLVDLMAGGNTERTNSLLDEFPRLRVLGIDRDDAPKSMHPRHSWLQVELSPAAMMNVSGTDPFALRKLLREGFAESPSFADLIIAKKALHELDRSLQPALLESCGAALHQGGRMVFFVDSPGPTASDVDWGNLNRSVERHDALRRLLLDPATTPKDVKTYFANARYLADPLGELLFVNDWTAVKDWANSNQHELAHRYFASLAELCAWADPWFGNPLTIDEDFYDINALRFNERGVSWVLHYLERNKADREKAIARDLSTLASRLGGSDRFRVLVDITRTVLDKRSAFATMLGATPSAVSLADIEPILKPLETAETAPQFKLRCAVVEFERQRRRSTPVSIVGATALSDAPARAAEPI